MLAKRNTMARLCSAARKGSTTRLSRSSRRTAGAAMVREKADMTFGDAVAVRLMIAPAASTCRRIVTAVATTTAKRTVAMGRTIGSILWNSAAGNGRLALISFRSAEYALLVSLEGRTLTGLPLFDGIM